VPVRTGAVLDDVTTNASVRGDEEWNNTISVAATNANDGDDDIIVIITVQLLFISLTSNTS